MTETRRLLFCLLLCLCLGAWSTAGAELNVVQTACNILTFDDECHVYCCAQVHNDSDYLAGMEQGLFRLISGDTVLAEENVERLWPYFVDANGDGYLFQTVIFYPDEDGNLEIPSITGLSYQLASMTVPVSAANETLLAEAEIERTETGGYVLICKLQNTDSETAWNPLVTYGLYTSGGSMLYADGLSLENTGIGSGSTLELRFAVNAQIVKQWVSYGVEPTEVRVQGFYRRDSD